MRALTWDEFAGAGGTVFEVPCGDESFELTLEQAEQLPSAGREGGSFRLEFRGPFEPVLPQAIYLFRHGPDEREIFIVPIGRDRQGTRYEAVFY